MENGTSRRSPRPLDKLGAELHEIRENHQRVELKNGTVVACSHYVRYDMYAPWPCQTRQLAERLWICATALENIADGGPEIDPAFIRGLIRGLLRNM